MDHTLGEKPSKFTLRSSFFDNLWPLILEDNICDINSKDSSDYFKPHNVFRQWHWHKFLANVNYPNYAPPIALRCCKAGKLELANNEAAEIAADELAEQLANKTLDYAMPSSNSILPIDQQISKLRQEHEHRQKLAYDFATRQYPWTMQRPSEDLGFNITAELLALFKNPLEREILIAINTYELKLMLIDAGTEVCFEDFQRWIKFRKFVQIIALVRCPRVEAQLQLVEGVFTTLLVEENHEASWHEELQSSLRKGFTYARQHQMHENCAAPFVYIFSDERGICTCNAFEILRLM